jgi:hypothetical protein
MEMEKKENAKRKKKKKIQKEKINNINEKSATYTSFLVG